MASLSLQVTVYEHTHTHRHTLCLCCVNRSDTWKEIMNGRQAGESLERASITEEEIALEPSITIFNYLERSLSSLLSILRYPVRSLFFIAIFKLD